MVAGTYRTERYRILISWSLGGLFAVHTLLEEPGAFDAYIAVSPSLPHRAFAPAIAQSGRSPAGFRFQSVTEDSWHSLDEYRGKVVLLNVWATWCKPCRREIPELERTQQELAAKGLVVLMGSSLEPRLIREHLTQHPIRTEQGYMSEATEDAVSWQIAGIKATPFSQVVDRLGVVREVPVGSGNARTYSALTREYLQQESVPAGHGPV